MTYEEVVKAMEEGKQLQKLPLGDEDYLNVSYEEVQKIAPSILRIKPEESKRRVRMWINDGTLSGSFDPLAESSIELREVRPGDLTREEIESRILDYSVESLSEDWKYSVQDVQRIFGVEDE